jgi:hypothetical protein
MAIVSKPESDDKKPLQGIFFWTDVKEIFNYFTLFSEEECYLSLSDGIVE